MDKTSGSVLGGDEIFLLCDKVQKGEGPTPTYMGADSPRTDFTIVCVENNLHNFTHLS